MNKTLLVTLGIFLVTLLSCEASLSSRKAVGAAEFPMSAAEFALANRVESDSFQITEAGPRCAFWRERRRVLSEATTQELTRQAGVEDEGETEYKQFKRWLSAKQGNLCGGLGREEIAAAEAPSATAAATPQPTTQRPATAGEAAGETEDDSMYVPLPGDPEAMARACANVDPTVRLKPMGGNYRLEVRAIVCAFNITGYEQTLLASDAPPRLRSEWFVTIEGLYTQLPTVQNGACYVRDLKLAMGSAYLAFSRETNDVAEERLFHKVILQLNAIPANCRNRPRRTRVDPAAAAARDVAAAAQSCALADPSLRLTPVNGQYLEAKAIVCAFNLTGYERTVLAANAPPRLGRGSLWDGRLAQAASLNLTAATNPDCYFRALFRAMREAYAIFIAETSDVAKEREFASVLNKLGMISASASGCPNVGSGQAEPSGASAGNGAPTMAELCAKANPQFRLLPIGREYLEVKAIVCAFNLTGYERTLLSPYAPPRLTMPGTHEWRRTWQYGAPDLSERGVSMVDHPDCYIQDLAKAMKAAYAIFVNENGHASQERAFADLMRTITFLANRTPNNPSECSQHR